VWEVTENDQNEVSDFRFLWSRCRRYRTEKSQWKRGQFVCLSVCLFVCLSVCLFVCLSVCLFVCLSVCLFVCLPGVLRKRIIFLIKS